MAKIKKSFKDYTEETEFKQKGVSPRPARKSVKQNLKLAAEDWDNFEDMMCEEPRSNRR